jgi:hypothetical protein
MVASEPAPAKGGLSGAAEVGTDNTVAAPDGSGTLLTDKNDENLRKERFLELVLGCSPELA